MHAYPKGHEVYLAHDKAVGEVLKAVSNIQYDGDAYILAQAARIVSRRAMTQCTFVTSQLATS